MRRHGTRIYQTTGKRYSVFSIAAGALFLVILGVIVAGQRAFSFAYDRTYLLANWWIMLIVLALLSAIAWGRRFFIGKPRRAAPLKWFLPVYFTALLALQLVATHSIWFYPGWDVNRVWQTAAQIAAGETFDGSYFAMCPNNAIITMILVAPLWVAGRLGLAVPYAVLPYLSAALVNAACFVCVLCVRKLTKSRLARAGSLFFCTTWIAFSATVTVPYTDTFSILFPVLALYTYLSDLRTFPKWLLIALLSSVGAAIKPTAAIFLIALVLVSAFRFFPLSRMTPERRRRTAAILAAIVIGVLPGRALYHGAILYLGGDTQPQGQLCDTHYLMLGMNNETYGGHSPADNEFSLSYPTLEERRTATLREAWRRFSARGVAGNLRFFTIKLYKAYSDGTLASNTSYLKTETPLRTDAFSVTLRKFYDPKKDEGILAATVEQGLWISILTLCAILLLRRRGSGITALLGFTLAGVTAYLLLFEVWPRYLFLYAPFFVVSASLGLERLRWPTRLRWRKQAE